jgi:hypothetical protein
MKIKKPAKEKPVLVNLKVMKKELKALTAKARKYAGGNLSLWLRHAGTNHIPKRKDLAS